MRLVAIKQMRSRNQYFLVLFAVLVVAGTLSIRNEYRAVRDDVPGSRSPELVAQITKPYEKTPPISVPKAERPPTAIAKPNAPLSAAPRGDSDSKPNCEVAAKQRLRVDCWVSGVSGNYTGARTKAGGIVGGRSQSQEDINLLERYFFMVRNGTFLEMGALNGLRYSNSYLFERTFGWRGVLIEGSPHLYPRLVKNRPEAITVNAMVCTEERRLHWIEAPDPAVSGVWEFMTPKFRKRWHSRLTENAVQQLPTIPCVRLDKILADHGVVHVDLFSLDVEGAELSVLQSINFGKFSASVILVEFRPGQVGVVEHLTGAGYVMQKEIGPNYVFVHPRFLRTLL